MSGQENQFSELNVQVKSSILQAIQANLAREQEMSLERVGTAIDAVASAVGKDLYTKGPPGDNYGKNTGIAENFQNVVLPSELLTRPGGPGTEGPR
jgi:hypothetical protein